MGCVGYSKVMPYFCISQKQTGIKKSILILCNNYFQNYIFCNRQRKQIYLSVIIINMKGNPVCTIDIKKKSLVSQQNTIPANNYVEESVIVENILRNELFHDVTLTMALIHIGNHISAILIGSVITDSFNVLLEFYNGAKFNMRNLHDQTHLNVPDFVGVVS